MAGRLRCADAQRRGRCRGRGARRGGVGSPPLVLGRAGRGRQMLGRARPRCADAQRRGRVWGKG